MEKFSANEFYLIAKLIENICHSLARDGSEGRDSPELRDFLGQVKDRCKSIGLQFSVKHIDRILSQLENGKLAPPYVAVVIDELSTRIRDEMSVNLFMFMSPKQAEFYNQPELFGQEVNAKFPNIQYDLVEAGNCYACARSTATVFHLMRIMETGVQEFGNKLSVSLVNEKTGRTYLMRLTRKLKL